MTLEEYAKKYQTTEKTEKERKIEMLEGQLQEIDYKNDPWWLIRETRKENEKIREKIRKLRKEDEE